MKNQMNFIFKTDLYVCNFFLSSINQKRNKKTYSKFFYKVSKSYYFLGSRIDVNLYIICFKNFTITTKK